MGSFFVCDKSVKMVGSVLQQSCVFEWCSWLSEREKNSEERERRNNCLCVYMYVLLKNGRRNGKDTSMMKAAQQLDITTY